MVKNPAMRRSRFSIDHSDPTTFGAPCGRSWMPGTPAEVGSLPFLNAPLLDNAY
jgi:hypothetical protein